MIKRTLILPTRDNAGASLRAALAQTQRELLRVAGGYTSWPTLGAWTGPDGRVYRDRGRAYSIILDPAADAELAAMLPAIAARLRQQAIYTDVTEVAVSFVSPEE